MRAFDSITIDPLGCNLIEASAGTGKTYAISSLYVRLVIEFERFKPENLLVVTFTEAATKELRDRIRKRLREARDAASGQSVPDPFMAELMSANHPGWPGSETALARLDLALNSFDCAAIFTIHGFCSRALQENAFESGSLFDTQLVTNQKHLINQIVDDFWRSRFFTPEAPLLPLAETEGWRPEVFTAFLKGKLTNPALRIVPEFTPVEIQKIRQECTDTYGTLCNVWRTSRAEIEQILREHPGLSRSQKNYHPTDVVPGLIDAMDTYVTRGTPYGLFSGHTKLTAGYMNTNGNFIKKHGPPEHPFFPLWDELVVLVHKMALTVYGELIEYAQKSLPERKNALNLRFFDDLLVDLHRALTGPGGPAMAERMRGKYRAALIDEFQDTDQIQYQIFRSIFKEGTTPLFVIGDPKQAIYSFRGADIYAYLEAKDDVPDDHHHTMTCNWRSSEGLVEAVNQLFSLNRDNPLVIDGLSYPKVQVPDRAGVEVNELTLENRNPSPMQLWFFPRQGSEGSYIPLKRVHPAVINAVTDEIAALLKDATEGKASIGTAAGARAVVPGDIAVIVRGHKQAGKVYESLQSRGIPAVVRSDQSIFKTQEAQELLTLLNALAEPGQEAKVRASLATFIMGVPAHDIARTFSADGEAEWEKHLDSFREYHFLWKKYGFMTMFRAFLESEGVRSRLLVAPGGERSITNLLHCGELLHAEAAASHRSVDSLCTWFSEQVSAPPDGDEHQIRLESDEKAVKILTIHVSKGLEFPIVFCPFLWGGVYDGGDTAVAHEGYELIADFGSESFDRHHRAALDEALAENVRLLYVALTRAKYRCYVAWGRFRYSESSALAYLFHAPAKTTASSPYEELVQVMTTIDDNAMIDKIRPLTSAGHINLTMDPDSCSAGRFSFQSEGAPQLTCRTMTKAVESEWRVSSFSSLIDGHATAPELPDHDSSDEAERVISDEIAPENSFLAFPKGADPGTFLHSIFEEVDFTAVTDQNLSDLVTKAMAISPTYEKYATTVQTMLGTVLRATLFENFTLSSLQPGSWVQEMEFYFPLKAITPKLLADFFRKQGITSPVNLEQVAESLNFQNVQGILLGFIDLVFCHDGRHYILDWKSNHLGNQPEKYTPGNLAREMERKLYPLQYLIYTVAVHRYLQRRVPGYTYETHFGGALYLFLRGIDSSRPGNGIYFDKPDTDLVLGLTRCLIDCEETYHGK